MTTVKCPKCGRELEQAGQAPGSTLTCACGNGVVVPGARSRRKGCFIALGVVGALLLLPCIAGLLPPWGRTSNHPKSRQSECRVNLRSWYTSQRAFLQEKDALTPSIARCGFAPNRGNRYAYFAGPGPLEDRSAEQAVGTAQAVGVGVDTLKHPDKAVTFAQLPEHVARQVGLSGRCPECTLTVACLGQIDRDETLDVWTLSTADRTAADGTFIPKGEPYNDVDDSEL